MTNALPLPFPIQDPAIQADLDALAIDAGAPRAYNRLTLTDSVKVTDMAKDANGLAAEAFAAYRGTSAQTITTGTLTKIQFNAEIFDFSSRFDSTTNYRYTPQVKGVYRISALIVVALVGSGKFVDLWLYKNGGLYQYLNNKYSPAVDTDVQVGGTSLVAMNGSTDYLEVWVQHNNGSSRDINNSSLATAFQGELVGRQS